MPTFERKNRWDGKVLLSAGGATRSDGVQQAVQERAYLRSADLYGADLHGANLRGANLYGADLRSADLGGAYLGGADLRSADLYGADLSGAYLSGANLSGADLGGAYLGGAYLGGANLRSADLYGAYLSGANLSGANLSGAYDKQLTLVGSRPVFMLGPIGSRCDYLTAYLTDAGVHVRAGCFFDTIEAFRAAVVAEHADNNHGREYMAAIAMIEAHAAIWSSAAVAVKEVA